MLGHLEEAVAERHPLDPVFGEGHPLAPRQDLRHPCHSAVASAADAVASAVGRL